MSRSRFLVAAALIVAACSGSSGGPPTTVSTVPGIATTTTSPTTTSPPTTIPPTTTSSSTTTTTTTTTVPPTTTSSSTTTTIPPLAIGVECVDGTAGGFPCLHADLVGLVEIGELGGDPDSDFVSDLWGWTDPITGSEVVIVSLARGTAFVDISDPVQPSVLGFLPLPSLVDLIPVQDIKVYADHAYIVGETPGHGMQVVDLRALVDDGADAEGLVTEVARYVGIETAHNLAMDEVSGVAYILGSNECAGGLHIVDLTDPAVPTEAGCFDEDGYTHDAQCLVYEGPDGEHAGKRVCFAVNEDTLTVVDVTDPAAPSLLSRTPYDDVGYAHQGWLSVDSRYFFMGDELDELDFGINTRMLVFDLLDLDAPWWVGDHVGELPAVDHNLFIIGDLLYRATYRAGLRVLDVSSPETLDYPLVAWFDTFPAGDGAAFDGAFGVYPFFESGVIAVSDIDLGLALVRLTLDN